MKRERKTGGGRGRHEKGEEVRGRLGNGRKTWEGKGIQGKVEEERKT